MSNSRTCSTCGAAFAAVGPQEVCPRCQANGGANPPFEASTAPYLGLPGAAPTPAELAGHFPQLDILALIGQGGMGAVYQARQRKLDRTVAVKILPAPVARDGTFAERFVREAQTMAKLSHPNIVAIHDYGESGGLFFFIMEYVDGTNLRELLRARPVPPEQALPMIVQVCDALQFAHEEGGVHRDIKPENLLIDKRGRVRIADFGLAKLLNRAPFREALTRSQQVMGTPHYMAPEQMEKPLEVDHRADIYSLGVVFYEMLTGELPLGHFAPPSQKAGVDPRLDEVVLRALAKDPGKRFQDVGALKTAVESIASGTGASSAVHGPEAGRPTRATPLRAMTSRAVALARTLRWPGGWRRLFGTPLGWALLGCLAGVAIGFVPWTRVEFSPPAGGFMGMGFTVSGSGGFQSGFATWHGIAVTVIFAVMALPLYLVGRRHPSPRWLPLPLLLAGLAVSTVAGLLLWELAQPRQFRTTEVSTSGNLPDTMMQPLQELMTGMLQQMLEAVKVTPAAGPYLAIGLGVGLFSLAAWAFRASRRRPLLTDCVTGPPSATPHPGG